MDAREICERLHVELVTPADFAARYGLELDCDEMTCDNVITVRDTENLAIVCHEIAHVLYPAIDNHNVVIWLGILIQVSLRKDLQ